MVLADAGAAVMIEQRDLSGERLAETVGRLLDDPARLAGMREAMRSFAQPDAARLIVDRIVALAGESHASA
jgi:UDP-N-acetylglucosamine--N-acetylmuramyl-(pentapeptide) pyrophosphoryl-undecaprenol N-acetylglucosamine transferase